MDFMFLNPKNWDKESREQFIDNQVQESLKGKVCTTCRLPMSGELDPVCSGTHPLTFAHKQCWMIEHPEWNDTDD